MLGVCVRGTRRSSVCACGKRDERVQTKTKQETDTGSILEGGGARCAVNVKLKAADDEDGSDVRT